MFKVKFTPYRSELGTIYQRQTQGQKLISLDGRYRFFVNEPVKDPDFWIVQGKGIRQEETCHVAPENTIFLATEPRSVLVYPHKYLRQFGHVCSCQAETRHPHIHLGPAILPWFVGFTELDGQCKYTLTYDHLSTSPFPKKEKLISVITSNKAFTQGHLDRIRFVEKLKNHYGDKIDVFGRGFRPFDDKWDVLAPYKYHIAIENSSQDYYWTEKISDCYLAGAFPFYYGCTNLKDYFPQDAFCPINIHDADRAISIIDEMITHSVSQKAMKEAKQLVLNQYNMFEYVARLCDHLNPQAKKEEVTIHPCRSTDDWHNFYNYTIARNFFKLKMKICGYKL